MPNLGRAPKKVLVGKESVANVLKRESGRIEAETFYMRNVKDT